MSPPSPAASSTRCGSPPTLAGFLRALHAVDPAGGPPPGPHSFLRGAPPSVYDEQTRAAIRLLDDPATRAAATAIWDTACAATWTGPPVWFHGDVAAGNLLVRDGRLAAVIDFGTSGVGDPACDLTIAWTLFSGASRDAFRDAFPMDPGAWARGRGWALWKALITVTDRDTDPALAAAAGRVLEQTLG